MKRKIKCLIFLFILSFVFIPFVGVKADTTINEVTVRVTLPNVGDLVLPEGYTGTDYDNIEDDGISDPTLYPTVTSLTEGVIIRNPYYVISTDDIDHLFFGQYKKGDTAYIDVYVECETSEYRLADNLTIHVQYTKGLMNVTKSPEYQDEMIHTKSGYNIDYTEFAFSVPVLNKFTVTFDSKGGSVVANQELTGSGVTESATVTRPDDPTRDNYDFIGWYTDTDCTDGNEFDFSVSISDPITLYAKWEETTEEYVISSGDVTATFTYDKGYNFDLAFVDILTLSLDEINELSDDPITEEMYDQLLDVIKENAGEYGTFISFYAIEIQDTHVNPNHGYGGQVRIRMKMTDEMKKYTSFKFVYLDDQNGFQAGDVANFVIDGDYIVGTLPHLSAYAIVGNGVAGNPQTGDNVILYVSILGLSAVGLFFILRKKSVKAN